MNTCPLEHIDSALWHIAAHGGEFGAVYESLDTRDAGSGGGGAGGWESAEERAYEKLNGVGMAKLGQSLIVGVSLTNQLTSISRRFIDD